MAAAASRVACLGAYQAGDACLELVGAWACQTGDKQGDSQQAKCSLGEVVVPSPYPAGLNVLVQRERQAAELAVHHEGAATTELMLSFLLLPALAYQV